MQGLYAIVNLEKHNASRCAWEFKLLQDTVVPRRNAPNFTYHTYTRPPTCQSRCTLFGGTELPDFCTPDRMFVALLIPNMTANKQVAKKYHYK